MVTKKTKTKKASKTKASALRQLTGAVVGGSLALVAYYAYDFGSPVLTTWLLSDHGIPEVQTNTFAQEDLSSYDKRLVQTQVRRIAAAAQAQPSHTEEADPGEDIETIWEQKWNTADTVSPPVEEVPVEEPVEPVYMPEPTAVDEESTEEPLPVLGEEAVAYAEQAQNVPALPDSGLGILLAMTIAGAGAGMRIQKRTV